MNKIKPNISLSDVCIIKNMGMDKEILAFAQKSQNITNDLKYELNLIGVNNKVLSGTILNVIRAGRIELRYDDVNKLSPSCLFVPINANNVASFKLLINMSHYGNLTKDVDENGNNINRYKFKDSIQVLYTMLLDAITVYATIFNTLLSRTVPHDIKTAAVKAHSEMLISAFNGIKRVSNTDHQIYLNILISTFGSIISGSNKIKSESDIRQIMILASERVIRDNFKNLNVNPVVKVDALILILSRLHKTDNVYDSINTKDFKTVLENIAYVIPEYKGLTYNGFLFKYANTFGVISMLNVEYMPYLLGTMITCKERFALHGNKYIYGTINETSKLVYDSLLKFVSYSLQNVSKIKMMLK